MSDLLSKIDKKTLQYYGIKHLWLFGSFARGEENNASDIDLLYEYDSGLDQSFAGIYGLYPILENIFQKKIDLADINGLHQTVKKHILDHRVKIF